MAVTERLTGVTIGWPSKSSDPTASRLLVVQFPGHHTKATASPRVCPAGGRPQEAMIIWMAQSVRASQRLLAG